MKGCLKIECLSDTCFSVPATQDASVDVEAASDSLGLPHVSGKTLHGLLRDTYLSAQEWLDKGNHGFALLGTAKNMSQTQGVLRIGDAYLSDANSRDVRPHVAALQDNLQKRGFSLPQSTLRDAFFSVRTFTAEERTTGAPKPESLRFVRVLPAGTVLTAPLTTTQTLPPDAQLLLRQLCQLTRHAGVFRNRGMGAVRLTISWDLSKTEKHSSFLVPVPCSFAEETSVTTQFLHYRVTLTAPCLIAGSDIDRNTQSTQLFLPGSVLRGSVAAALLTRGLSDAETGAIVASGAVRFLPAYPEVDSQRALPTPITYRRIKDARYADTDREASPYDALWQLCSKEDTTTPNKQQQPISSPFVTQEGVIAQPMRQFTTHQRRNRSTGVTRKDSDETVFVYESLQAGQSFCGVIAISVKPDTAQWPQLLQEILTEEKVWLGRSRRASYGGNPVFELLAMTDTETQTFPDALGDENEFVLRLTSPAVLRHPITGQHDPYYLKTAVAERMGEGVEIVGVCMQMTTVRSFSRLWRTELPALPAAAAGSVVLLRVRAGALERTRNGTVPMRWLRDRAAQPLGERVAEGYGCFVFEPVAYNPVLVEPKPAVAIPPTGPTPLVLREAQRRLYRRRLESLVAAHALHVADGSSVSYLPNVSLLQRLREPLRESSGQSTATWQRTYQQWLAASPTSTTLRAKAKRALQETWLGNGSLHDLLLQASQPGWNAPAGTQETDERTRNRLVEEGEAKTIWAEVKTEPALHVLYLDTLLSALARRKQKETAG